MSRVFGLAELERNTSVRKSLTTGPCMALWLMLGFCLVMSVVVGGFISMKLADIRVIAPKEIAPPDSIPEPGLRKIHDNTAKTEVFDFLEVRGEELFRALIDRHGDLTKEVAFRDSLTVDVKTE